MTEIISITLLDFNKGQLAGLPKNPRFFRDYRYEAMKKSISDCPEMLELRELIVYPYMGRYIVVCGNLRLRACKELGYTELPCKILAPDVAVKKLKSVSTQYQMIRPFILSFQSMTKNMSYSSSFQAMRLIVTGSVRG